MAEPVGLIGLGLMGSAFASRLLNHGYRVVGFDIDATKRAELHQAGGEAVNSLNEVARRSLLFLLAVPDIAHVEAVVEGPQGLLGNIRPGPKHNVIALCTTTCEPDRLEALATRCRGRGLTLIDAPVSGTSQQVRNGDGLGLIGGERIEDAKGIINAIYPRSYIVGDVGSGTRTKLAINLILGLNRLALAEGLVFAEKLRIEKSTFLKIARDSAAYSQIMDVKGEKMVNGEYSPVSKVSPHLKDVRIMLEEAERRGQPLPLVTVLADILESCERRGEGACDNSIIIEEIRRRGHAER